MTKKPSLKETQEATQKMAGSQFVNYDLTADDKAAFKKWAHEQIQDAWDMVDKLLDSGYHVSIKRDTYNGCYGCFVICKSANDPNNGYILTGRGTTSQAALLGALYRHLVIFEGAWDTDGFRRNGTDDE